MSEVPLQDGDVGPSLPPSPRGGPDLDSVQLTRVCERHGEVESGPLRAVQLSRHKWPGGLVN